VVLSALLAFGFWLGVLFYWAASWQNSFIEILSGIAFFASWMTAEVWGISLAKVLFWIFTLPLGFYIASASILLILSLIGVPWIRWHLKARYPIAFSGYAGGSLASTMVNIFKIFLLSAILFFAIVFFFWVPGVWGIGLFCLAVWMNTKLLFLEIANEVVFPQGAAQVWRDHQLNLLGLGLIFGFLFTIPFVNLIAPVWMALSLFHYLCALSESSSETSALLTRNEKTIGFDAQVVQK
jgi:hypothetical protein